MHALTVSLGQGQTTNRDKTCDDDNEKLSQVCLRLNGKLHSQINKMIEQDYLNPHMIEHFDVDKSINLLDPDIWKAVCLLTKPS